MSPMYLLLDKMQLKKPPAKRRSVSIASDHTPFLRLQKEERKSIFSSNIYNVDLDGGNERGDN